MPLKTVKTKENCKSERLPKKCRRWHMLAGRPQAWVAPLFGAGPLPCGPLTQTPDPPPRPSPCNSPRPQTPLRPAAVDPRPQTPVRGLGERRAGGPISSHPLALCSWRATIGGVARPIFQVIDCRYVRLAGEQDIQLHTRANGGICGVFGDGISWGATPPCGCHTVVVILWGEGEGRRTLKRCDISNLLGFFEVPSAAAASSESLAKLLDDLLFLNNPGENFSGDFPSGEVETLFAFASSSAFAFSHPWTLAMVFLCPSKTKRPRMWLATLCQRL